MYLLKLAVRPWRSAPLSQALGAFVVGLLILLAGALLWLEQGLRPVVARLEQDQIITAYVSSSVSRNKERDLTDRIRVALGAAPGRDGEAEDSAESARAVAGPGEGALEVRFVGTKEFLSELKSRQPELIRELSSLGGGLEALVPRYVSVAGKLPADALERIRGIDGVDSVESSKDRFRHSIGAFVTLSWISRVLIAGLVVALFTGLVHLGRLNAGLFTDSLQLLKYWGADELKLKLPATLAGLLVGGAGGFIAAATWIAAGGWIAIQVRTLSPMFSDMASPAPLFAVQLLLAGVFAGLLSGASVSVGRG